MKNLSNRNKSNSIELSHLRNFDDTQKKADNYKVSINEPNKQKEGTINHDNSYNNASNLQAINNNISINRKKNSKKRGESAETETKTLFYVELKDYFFSKLFKRKSSQLVKYEQFHTIIKNLLSIEFLLEAMNEIPEMKNIILQTGAIDKI